MPLIISRKTAASFPGYDCRVITHSIRYFIRIIQYRLSGEARSDQLQALVEMVGEIAESAKECDPTCSRRSPGLIRSRITRSVTRI